jgi:hypothetical protein
MTNFNSNSNSNSNSKNKIPISITTNNDDNIGVINNTDNSLKDSNINTLTLIHKGILFFLLIISGNYIGNLLSCRIQDYFENDMYAKHIIAFISLYFFIILVEPKLQMINPLKSLLMSIPIYVYFLLLAKNDAKYFLIVIFCLLVLTFVHLQENYFNNKNKKTKFERKFLDNVIIIKRVIIIFIISISLFGFLIYLGMKKIEYKDNFNFQKFLLGKVICNHNFLGKDPSLSSSKYLIANHSINFRLNWIFLKKAFS